MKKIAYYTTGTCSKVINLVVNDDDRIESVEFIGGCNGNLQGIGALVKGMKTEDVISRLDGIRCGMKNTSCPDQLCRAIEEMKNSK